MAQIAENGQKSGWLGPLSVLPVVPAVEYLDWLSREGNVVPSVARTPSQPAPKSSTVLSDAELRFLRAVVEQPGRPSGEYARLAHVGTHQAVSIRGNLVEGGYLREHRVNTRPRGRTAIILEPLPMAVSAIKGAKRREVE